MAELEGDGSYFILGRNPRVKYQGRTEEYNIGLLTGYRYSAFYNIPYARKPTRMERFQAPQSVMRSSYESFEIMNGIQSLPIGNLHQPTQLLDMSNSDCLYLNIFLPSRHPELIEELLPVLVFIHGGGFDAECNYFKISTPDYIMQHGLVFVSIHYRQGQFGFLNLRTRDYPGNVGLKDQVMALEWIRDNIECFKGDPKNVTLSGFSAGATCVNFHLISPASKDLFHKAIVQSGGVYSPWGYKGHYLEQKEVLLNDPEFRRLSESETGSYELYKYVERVLKQDRSVRHPRTLSPMFGPSVEKFAEGAFITDELEEMMKNVQHDKPVMAGISKGEGIYFFVTHPLEDYKKWVNEDAEFLQFLMDNFRWSHMTAEMHMDEIRNKYFPDRLNSNETTMKINFAKLVSDISFRRFYDNFKFGPERAVHKNLFVYRFDHFSEICAASFRGIDQFHEPTHGDEISYLYCPDVIKHALGEYIYVGPTQNIDIEMVMDHMCSLWANFCKTGVPKSDFDAEPVVWRRHTEESPCYLSISTNLELKEEALLQLQQTWLNEYINEPTILSLASTPVESDDE